MKLPFLLIKKKFTRKSPTRKKEKKRLYKGLPS